jgi:hypothetical protein
VYIQNLPKSNVYGDGRNEHYLQIDSLPSLAELVRSDFATEMPCPIGTAPILDVISNNESTRRIPRILHFTSKSRCATEEVIEIVNQWRLIFPSHSIYFHDDAAVARLTNHPISQHCFPLLNETLKCATNGATKSDLWRYLVLYLYGGIYTDIDNRPGLKLNETTILPSDDFFAVVESLGIFAQYFMASSTYHPLMKLALETGISGLRGIPNVMNTNPSKTTGPGALKIAFINFMRNTTNGYIERGKYVGIDERTITVLGSKGNPKEYVNREGLDQSKKAKYYRAVGIEHFFVAYDLPFKGAISCMDHLSITKGTHKVANYTFDGSTYVDAIG